MMFQKPRISKTRPQRAILGAFFFILMAMLIVPISLAEKIMSNNLSITSVFCGNFSSEKMTYSHGEKLCINSTNEGSINMLFNLTSSELPPSVNLVSLEYLKNITDSYFTQEKIYSCSNYTLDGKMIQNCTIIQTINNTINYTYLDWQDINLHRINDNKKGGEKKELGIILNKNSTKMFRLSYRSLFGEIWKVNISGIINDILETVLDPFINSVIYQKTNFSDRSDMNNVTTPYWTNSSWNFSEGTGLGGQRVYMNTTILKVWNSTTTTVLSDSSAYSYRTNVIAHVGSATEDDGYEAKWLRVCWTNPGGATNAMWITHPSIALTHTQGGANAKTLESCDIRNETWKELFFSGLNYTILFGTTNICSDWVRFNVTPTLDAVAYQNLTVTWFMNQSAPGSLQYANDVNASYSYWTTAGVDASGVHNWTGSCTVGSTAKSLLLSIETLRFWNTSIQSALLNATTNRTKIILNISDYLPNSSFSKTYALSNDNGTTWKNSTNGSNTLSTSDYRWLYRIDYNYSGVNVSALDSPELSFVEMTFAGNTAPNINQTNTTINYQTVIPARNNIIQINLSADDPDGDYISYCRLKVQMPNGTAIDNVNMTHIGDTAQWVSKANFTIGASFGIYSYNVSCYDGTAVTSTILYNFTILNLVPNITRVNTSTSLGDIIIPNHSSTICLNASIVDGDDNLTWVNFTFKAENGTSISNVNGTYNNNEWISACVQTNVLGVWSYNISVSDGYNITQSPFYNFTISNNISSIVYLNTTQDYNIIIPNKSSSMMLNASLNDSDDSILSWVNFTLIAPNGTSINNQNGTRIGNNWVSRVNVSTDVLGIWQYNISTFDGYNKTISITYNFTINNSLSKFTALNTSYNYNTIIPNFSNSIYLNLSNVTDLDNDAIMYANISLFSPNHTAINNINATRTGIDWLSTNITIRVLGTWKYNASFFDGTNITQTPFYNFTVTDNTAPQVNLTLANNSVKYNSTATNFTYNVTENLDLPINCSLWVNLSGEAIVPIINASNVLNNTILNFSLQIKQIGTYNWTVNCTDTAGNINIAPQRYVNITANQAPTINLNYTDIKYPRIYDSNITIWANVSDFDNDQFNITVSLRMPNGTYKINSTLQNHIMSNLTLFNSTSFSTGIEGLWNYTITATDTNDLSSTSTGQIAIPTVYGYNLTKFPPKFYNNLTMWANLTPDFDNVTFLLQSGSRIPLINETKGSSTTLIWNSSRTSSSLITGFYYATFTFNSSKANYSLIKEIIFSITDVVEYTPISIAKSALLNKSENMTTEISLWQDSDENFTYYISWEIVNATWFGFNISPNNITYVAASNASNPVRFNATVWALNDSIPPDTYLMNITIKRFMNNLTNRTFIIPVERGIHPPAGQPVWLNTTFSKCTSSDTSSCYISRTLTETTSFTKTLTLNNTGGYNLTGCNVKFRSSAGGYYTWLSTTSNFGVTETENKNLTLTFTPPTAGSYTGWIQVNCSSSDAFGDPTTTEASNEPLIYVIATAGTGGSGGGGGGGGIVECTSDTYCQLNYGGNYKCVLNKCGVTTTNVTITPILSGCNYNGFCEITRNEDIWNCGTKTQLVEGTAIEIKGDCKPAWQNAFCDDPTQQCWFTSEAIGIMVVTGIGVAALAGLVMTRNMKKRRK